jgi:Na+-transporting NADH:ubiquinone oxidoreductase subunit NqrF
VSEHTVLFHPHNRTVTVSAGGNLIRTAMEARVHINASCGGAGVCGKCRVLIESGVVEGGITEKLSAEDLVKGYRLACQSSVRVSDHRVPKLYADVLIQAISGFSSLK